MKELTIATKGKDARTTSERLQPLVMAKIRPQKVMHIAIIINPILSPKAFWIA